MKNNLKNSFFKEKLYISLNSSICKNPTLNIKRFHPIKTIYSTINPTNNSRFQNETDIEHKLKERKNGSYKISSKRNFKTIIFQNWNTKNSIPTEIGNCLNFPVIMDKKQLIKNNTPINNNIEMNNLKYEYYYPVSNRKDLILSSNKKEENSKRLREHKKFHSHDKGWRLITNYFYKNKKERDLKKRQLLKMKLTAKNLSVFKNKEKIKEETKINNSKNIINDEKKMNKTNYQSEKIIKDNNNRIKSKTSLKILDLEKIEEKKSKKGFFSNIQTISKSNISSSISDNNKILESKKNENIENEKINLEKIENENENKEKNKILNGENDGTNENNDSTLDKSIDWETFQEFNNLENNQFLYAIKKGKPLSYHLIDFKELKRLNEIEMKEKYYKHKLNKTNATLATHHSQNIFIINYMTISSENVIIYINGKPEYYNINEFKSLYLNYKALTNIPIFKYWIKSKIFKLWLNYVQRQRRKKYEKKLKEKLHILDKPIAEGIMEIKRLLRRLKEINIFRLNSKEAKFPNQFIIDYQKEIININKDFDYYRSRIKDIIKNMCEEEVHNFMVNKKMLDSKAVTEDMKLIIKIETQKKLIEDSKREKNSPIPNKENQDKDKDNIQENNNKSIDKENEIIEEENNLIPNEINNESEPISDKDSSNIEDDNLNYKLNKHKKILKNMNINIPEDLYKRHITKEEKFKNELNNFIKNETNYAQLSTKRNFYCIILRIIRIVDHFFNESKKDTICQSLSLLNKKIEKYYEFFKNNLNIFPLLKLSILTIGNSIKFMPEFGNLEELFFDKFIQENIFNFVNKKNFIDPQEFPIYMTCYEDVFEKSFDQNAALLIRLKDDENINNLIDSIRCYFYKLGDELNLKIDEYKLLLDNYYNYSKVNFKEFQENCTPHKIQEYLDYVYGEKEKVIKLNKINNIGLFELNIGELLDLIFNAPNTYIKKIKEIFPNILMNKQQKLINLLKENIKELTKEVKNVEGFIKLKHSFENCKENRAKIDENEAEIGDVIEIINIKNIKNSI